MVACAVPATPLGVEVGVYVGTAVDVSVGGGSGLHETVASINATRQVVVTTAKSCHQVGVTLARVFSVSSDIKNTPTSRDRDILAGSNTGSLKPPVQTNFEQVQKLTISDRLTPQNQNPTRPLRFSVRRRGAQETDTRTQRMPHFLNLF